MQTQTAANLYSSNSQERAGYVASWSLNGFVVKQIDSAGIHYEAPDVSTNTFVYEIGQLEANVTDPLLLADVPHNRQKARALGGIWDFMTGGFVYLLTNGKWILMNIVNPPLGIDSGFVGTRIDTVVMQTSAGSLILV